MPTYPTRNGDREHRVVWIEANGPIPVGHHVHHRNGNITDNRLENLELLSAADHIRHHHIGKPYSTATRKKMSQTRRKRLAVLQLEGCAGAAQPGRKQSNQQVKHRMESMANFFASGSVFGRMSANERSERARQAAHARWG